MQQLNLTDTEYRIVLNTLAAVEPVTDEAQQEKHRIINKLLARSAHHPVPELVEPPRIAPAWRRYSDRLIDIQEFTKVVDAVAEMERCWSVIDRYAAATRDLASQLPDYMYAKQED